VVPIGLEDFTKVLDLSNKYSNILSPCLGIHPVQRGQDDQRCVTLEDIEAALPVIEKHINWNREIKTLSNTFHSNSWSTIECMHQNISCTKFFSLPKNMIYQ
jgi:hypothetical protein